MSTSAHESKPVIVSYKQLQDQSSDSMLESVERAFSDQGLCAILVEDVPGFRELRDAQLRRIRELALDDPGYLRGLERPDLHFGQGWNPSTIGYEEGGDSLLGSFYCNVMGDDYVDDQGVKWVNVWPDDRHPGLREAQIALGKLMLDTGILVAKHIDRYCANALPQYEHDVVTKSISESEKITGRLMYYYAQTEKKLTKPPANWCSWHKDYSYLTALTPDLFFRKEKVIPRPIDAGLFIQKRNHQVVKLDVPE